MILLVNGHAPHIFGLFQVRNVSAPARGSELLFVRLVEKVDRARHVAAMANVTVHAELVHPCHLVEVAILSQQLQVGHIGILILVHLLQSRGRHCYSLGLLVGPLSYVHFRVVEPEVVLKQAVSLVGFVHRA